MASPSHIPLWTEIRQSEKADPLVKRAILRLSSRLAFEHLPSRGMGFGIICSAKLDLKTASCYPAVSDCDFLATFEVLPLILLISLRHCCLCMSILCRRNNLVIAMQRRMEKQALDWVHVCVALPLGS